MKVISSRPVTLARFTHRELAVLSRNRTWTTIDMTTTYTVNQVIWQTTIDISVASYSCPLIVVTL